MMRRLCGLSFCTLLSLGVLPALLAAQEPVTVTGHVSSGRMPVRGASVRIESLDVGALTDPDGRYSFIVPSTKVRGQTVTIIARYLRLRPQSIEITLVGGSLERDFELVTLDAPVRPGDQPRTVEPVAATTGGDTRPAPRSTTAAAVGVEAKLGLAAYAPVLDSTAFVDVSAPTSLASALSGRFAGVEVLTSGAIGGTSALYVRGLRTISGLTQPLVVLNGIEIDNSNFTSASQSSGNGGFDYGATLNDLNLDDIASVQLLRGPVAAMRYGGRAANGVLLVDTKNGRGLSGMLVAANQQVSSATPLRLFSYQNTYGQGRGGKFVFFDGKGGGVNDAVDESWGPTMDGQPIVQASFTEAGHPEVRAFTARPTNVSDFFRTGRSLTTNVAVQGGGERGNVRAALSNRSLSGITPLSNVTYRSAALTGGLQASARLRVSADLQLYSDRGEDRPGSGFDESNVVSVFSHMPRSVDVATYSTRLRDATGSQLSWNYAGHNNPWYAVTENDNHDERTRVLAGAGATLGLTDIVSATARIGRDDISDKRTFTVASGWMGGFPWYAGRGDFSSGGFQNDDIGITRTTAEVSVRAAPRATTATAYALNAGVGHRADDLSSTISASDKLAGTSTPSVASLVGSSTTNYVFGGIEATFDRYLSIAATARSESSQLLSASSSTTLYPSVLGSIDLARRDAGSPAGALETFALRGGWSKSGNDATVGLLQRLGATDATSGTLSSAVSSPEVTSGWELGTTIRTRGSRAGLDVTYYNEQTEDVVFPFAASFAATGKLSNKGVEASGFLVPVRLPDGGEWTIGANIAKNTNLVESLGSGVTSISLGIPSVGAQVVARTGSSLGTVVGYGYRRDAAGGLALRNGVPQADSAAGVKVLGSSLPTWAGGLSSSFRRRSFEVSVLFDARHGGKIFSASNRAAAVSGNLEETVVRPDSGLLIAGTDLATGAANTLHATTEEYYRALGAIGERWMYDASFVKLREARVTYSLPLVFIQALHTQSARLSIIGRNLALWTNAPNIDPETVLSTSSLRGAELGQLPTMKSIGFQLSLTP
ncbi:MAG: TonB-dependent receptor plug domain-containing protein [Gemmatimonadaceae bacterium]